MREPDWLWAFRADWKNVLLSWGRGPVRCAGLPETLTKLVDDESLNIREAFKNFGNCFSFRRIVTECISNGQWERQRAEDYDQ